ncbi:hypothetical protein JCM1840_004819 [Sporobolomyces johnsonii]
MASRASSLRSKSKSASKASSVSPSKPEPALASRSLVASLHRPADLELSEQKQFSISSFLPKGFGPSPSPSPSQSTQPNKGGKRKVADEEDEEVSDDEDEEKEASKRPMPKSKGKGKAKQVDVLDLTEDDDLPRPAAPRARSAKKQPAEQLEDADVLWVDKYEPASREELSIHPRKVSDVVGWLAEAFGPNPRIAKYRRVLVLSGPAGAGKTACLRVLAKEMGIEIVEWKETSNVELANDDARESVVHRFTSFLARAGMAPALDFGDSDDPIPSTSSCPAPTPSPSASSHTWSARRLILLEDLPNVSHYPTKLALRSALQQYLSSPRVTCPLVLIVSEALARPGADADNGGAAGWATGGRGDSVDARAVCGVEVLQHPACREIAFNPIAVTIMKKGLVRILDRIYMPPPPSSRSSSRSTTVSAPSPSTRPSASTLDLIIQHSNGDIRSALMGLQFLSMEGADGGGATSLGVGSKGAKAAGKGKKRKRDEAPGGGGDAGKDAAKRLLQFVTARESSLFVFHALGKVLYNKRWGDSPEDDKKDLGRPGIVQEREYDKLPKHLRKEWKRRPSKVDPDVLFAEAPLDSDLFLSYLHHNYAQFTSSIEECSLILDGLSAADALLRVEDDSSRRAPLTSLYSFALAVRTTLVSLPSPVERRKQTLRKSEMWDNLKVQRQNEEGVAELVRQRGGAAGAAVVPPFEEGGEGAGGCLRDRRSLMSEMIPWLGVIKPKNANPFLVDLATFPPLTSSTTDSSAILGDALGEKDLGGLDDENDGAAAAAEEEADGSTNVRRSDEVPATNKLEEVEVDDESEGVDGPGAGEARGGDELWDPEDDIDEVD